MLTGATKNFHSRENEAFYVFSPHFLLGTDSVKNTSLIESAAAFSSQPSRKYLLEKIDVITGEEAEHNVLKVCMSYIAFSGSNYIYGIRPSSSDGNIDRTKIFVTSKAESNILLSSNMCMYDFQENGLYPFRLVH
jgi:hypothetical protein